jgi:hypothetical protein
VLLTDKKISLLEVLTAVREEISKTDYDPFYLTVLGRHLAINAFNETKMTKLNEATKI